MGEPFRLLFEAEKAMTAYPADGVLRFHVLSKRKAVGLFSIESKEQDSETVGKSTQRVVAKRACDITSSYFLHGIVDA